MRKSTLLKMQIKRQAQLRRREEKTLLAVSKQIDDIAMSEYSEFDASYDEIFCCYDLGNLPLEMRSVVSG